MDHRGGHFAPIQVVWANPLYDEEAEAEEITLEVNFILWWDELILEANRWRLSELTKIPTCGYKMNGHKL